MINELIKLATHLDNKGYHREANIIDEIIKVSGELIDLDERRKLVEEQKAFEPGKPRERQDPKMLMENFKALQDALNEIQEEEVEGIELAVHLDDGETYTSLDNIAVVTVTQDEMNEILEASKINDIVNENRMIEIENVLDRAKLNELMDI